MSECVLYRIQGCRVAIWATFDATNLLIWGLNGVSIFSRTPSSQVSLTVASRNPTQTIGRYKTELRCHQHVCNSACGFTLISMRAGVHFGAVTVMKTVPVAPFSCAASHTNPVSSEVRAPSVKWALPPSRSTTWTSVSARPAAPSVCGVESPRSEIPEEEEEWLLIQNAAWDFSWLSSGSFTHRSFAPAPSSGTWR